VHEAVVGVVGVRLDVVDGHVPHQPLELRLARLDAEDGALATGPGDQTVLDQLDLGPMS
jgi:hypothetical protein